MPSFTAFILAWLVGVSSSFACPKLSRLNTRSSLAETVAQALGDRKIAPFLEENFRTDHPQYWAELPRTFRQPPILTPRRAAEFYLTEVLGDLHSRLLATRPFDIPRTSLILMIDVNSENRTTYYRWAYRDQDELIDAGPVLNQSLDDEVRLAVRARGPANAEETVARYFLSELGEGRIQLPFIDLPGAR